MSEARSGPSSSRPLAAAPPRSPVPVMAVAFAVGLVTTVVLHFWRGFFWPHAAISGLAVAALVYSAWRTWRNLRQEKR